MNMDAPIVAPSCDPESATKAPPQKETPTYPAGTMAGRNPPRKFVTPPSLWYTSILSTLPPVNQAAEAWPISWMKIAISFIGLTTAVFMKTMVRREYPPYRHRKMISSVWQHPSSFQFIPMVTVSTLTKADDTAAGQQ